MWQLSSASFCRSTGHLSLPCSLHRRPMQSLLPSGFTLGRPLRSLGRRSERGKTMSSTCSLLPARSHPVLCPLLLSKQLPLPDFLSGCRNISLSKLRVPNVVACIQYFKGISSQCKSQENKQATTLRGEKNILLYKRYCLWWKSRRINKQSELPKYFNTVMEHKLQHAKIKSYLIYQ